jgi:hypothetical protein
VTDQRDQRFTLALDEARRAIDQQKVDVDNVRSRSAALLGFAGLAASFVGGLTLRDDVERSRWIFVGVGAFVGIAACAIVIHWPRKLIFAQSSATILDWLDANETTATMRHLDRDLAEHFAGHYSRNQRKINGMFWAFQIALFLLLIEIVALLIDLRGRA